MVKLTADEAWQFWNESLGSPKYILAPMVNASELQYRILCKRYGVDVAYTPMLHSRLLFESKDYRPKMHPTPLSLPTLYGAEEGTYEAPKTIAQVCGHEPAVVVKGCQLIEDSVMAIDLNCGCPQGIAKRGHYGSYLLETPEVILNVVEAMVEQLKVPVTVKIRIVDEIDEAQETPDDQLGRPGGLASYRTDISEACQRTFELVAALEKLGVAAICIHGRTSKNKGHAIRAAEWGVIKEIVRGSKIPIIANGSMRTKEDADLCLKFTGAAAVMSAVGLLSDPAMFMQGDRPTLAKLMRELCYLYENVKVDGKVFSAPLKSHVFHALHSSLQKHTDIRSRLDAALGVVEVRKICEEIDGLKNSEDESNQDVGAVLNSYYYRHLRKKSMSVHQLEPAPAPTKKLRLHAEQPEHEITGGNAAESASTADEAGIDV